MHPAFFCYIINSFLCIGIGKFARNQLFNFFDIVVLPEPGAPIIMMAFGVFLRAIVFSENRFIFS